MQANNALQSTTATNYLESQFQGTESKNIESFIKSFEKYASILNDSEIDSVLTQQISNIEQSILKTDMSELGPKTLLSAIIEKSPELAIKYMSVFKSSVNLPSRGRLPLIEACYSRQVDLVKALLKNGANPDLKDRMDNNAIGRCLLNVDFMCPTQKDKEIFNALLEANCDVNVSADMVNSSPLIICCNKRLDDWAWKLLPKSDVTYKNNLGMTALHPAVRYSFSMELISELIKRGCKVNALALEGLTATRRVTPCHIAVARGNTEILELLIDAGADPHKKAVNPFFRKGDDKEPYSAYLLAKDINEKECMQTILKMRPPSQRQLEMGFDRNFLNTPLGKKTTLQHIAEAEALKSQSVTIHMNKVNFAVEAAEEQNVRQMVKEFFLDTEKSGVHLYQPIWQAICTHAASNPDFYVIFSPQETGSLCGKYNPETHNEIVIYHKTLHYTKIGEALVHEMAHKCADMIYKTMWCAPTDSSHPLHEAIKIDLANLPTVNHKYASFIRDRFRLAPSYTNLQKPQECIARIPQVIFALIQEFKLSEFWVDAAMRQCLPNLYNYYLDEFVPECKKLAGKI